MTKQEIQTSTNDKISKIIELAKQLKIQISAKQAMVKGNFIESVVYFLDKEEYPQDPIIKQVLENNTNQNA